MGNYRYMLWAGLEFRVWKHSGQQTTVMEIKRILKEQLA